MISTTDSETKEYLVSAADAGLRLDHFLREAFPGVSRREIRFWIRERRVLCNGRAANKGQYLQEDDEVVVHASLGCALRPGPDTTASLRVLFEDPFLVAIDKPAGMATHPLRPGEPGTVANGLLARYPEMDGIGFSVLEPGIVHRLDRDTSGVLLAARSVSVFEELRAQFEQGRVTKTYLAVVHGHPDKRGTVDLSLGSQGRRARRVTVFDGKKTAKGVRRLFSAQTTFRVVRYLGPCSMVSLKMTTGVRHQLRAHMSHIGHPVVGDLLYGGEFVDHEGDRFRPSRHLLHASGIRFFHPEDKRTVKIRAPLPDDFQVYLAVNASQRS